MRPSKSEAELAKKLAGVPLFAELSPRHRKTLAKLGKVMTWKADTVALKEGTRGVAFFLLLDGAVDVKRGDEHLARIEAGGFVGEMALLTNKPRNADVVAVTDTNVFSLSRTALAAALETDHKIGVALLETMAGRQATML